MLFNWSRLVSPRGLQIKRPLVTKGVHLDLDWKHEATVFLGDRWLASLKTLAVEIHAAGIFLKGMESVDGKHLKYQEWFLSYGELRTSKES